MKRKLILHATNEHPAIYREGHRLVSGKDTSEASKEKGPAMNDLLPCPFCGGTSISIDRLDTGDPKYHDFVAQCFDCGASTGTHSEETFAAEAWDKRAGHVTTGSTIHTSREKTCLEMGADCPVCFPKGYDHDSQSKMQIAVARAQAIKDTATTCLRYALRTWLSEEQRINDIVNTISKWESTPEP